MESVMRAWRRGPSLAVLLICGAVAVSGCAHPATSGSVRHAEQSQGSGQAGRSDTAGKSSGQEPVRIRIPALHVNSDLLKLGIKKDGSVEVPPAEQGDRAGWYTGSTPPGNKGPSVVIGHNQTRFGDAVFYSLHELREGQKIYLDRKDGKAVVFTVRVLETVKKDSFPTERVYGATNQPALRLVTCAGGLDGVGHPVDNLIVYADQR